MYRPRPLTDKLECHVCGKPAKWYDREFHSTYVLGEALCDDCNSKYTQYKFVVKTDRDGILNPEKFNAL